ncbi:MAG: amidohydrolase [Phycisphaerales bacterium]
MNITPSPRPLREAHAHIASHGESLSLLDLSGCRSVGACLRDLANLARRAEHHDPRHTRDGWVLAFGARVESWNEQRWPTRRELDEASGPPCVIMSFDHHSAGANSGAMRLAGLDPAQHPGVLLEGDAYRAWNAAPEPSRDQRKRHVLASLSALAGLGVVEVHDMLSQDWLGPILGELAADGALPVQCVWLYPPVNAFDPARHEWESERVRLAGAKVFADGTLNSRTALMLHDYREPIQGLPRGQTMASAAELDAALLKVSAARGHLAVHAIGDAAVRSVLDAIERVNPRADDLGIRARIEHCELIDEADIPRFARLGVVASLQPCHLLYDIEALTRYLPHRLDRVLPIRELLESGCAAGMLTADQRRAGAGEVWFGSDVPIVRANAEDSVEAATRRSRADAPALTVAAAQRIDEATAWRCFEPAPARTSSASLQQRAAPTYRAS